MAKTDDELLQDCMQRFIQLANSIKDEGIDTKVVSEGLMTASAVYATYVFAGNDGGLTESGVEKVTQAYKFQLEQVQDAKRARTESKGQGKGKGKDK